MPEDNLTLVQENFVRHILPLRGFVYGLVPRRHLVDDVVQETFVTACQKADQFEPGTNFRAWIFAIARYKVLALLKTQGAKPGVLDYDVVDMLAEESEEDDNLQERVALLEDCVRKLARTAHQAIVLRYAEGLGPTEIAERMGWSVNALNVALSRARIFLRRCVEESQQNQRCC